MTTYRFVAAWPITDLDRTRSQLIVEASAHIDAIATQAGARITGPITWTIVGDRLTAQADATPTTQPPRAPHGTATANAELIRTLARRGLPDRVIADQLGCSESAVAKVRARHHIPPGGTPFGRPRKQGAAA